MRSVLWASACLATFISSCTAALNLTEPLSSKRILPGNFIPPQDFRNLNLVRNVNLEKGYARETINVVIENVGSKPQDEYYIPFESEILSRIGGFEARDKKDAEKPPFPTEVLAFDTQRCAGLKHLVEQPLVGLG